MSSADVPHINLPRDYVRALVLNEVLQIRPSAVYIYNSSQGTSHQSRYQMSIRGPYSCQAQAKYMYWKHLYLEEDNRGCICTTAHNRTQHKCGVDGDQVQSLPLGNGPSFLLRFSLVISSKPAISSYQGSYQHHQDAAERICQNTSYRV